MPRYTIAALVPDPWAAEIHALRRQFDRWSRQWLPPHLTIVPPVSADISLPMVVEIETFPADIAVNWQGWGAFHHERSNVIWLHAGQGVTDHLRPKLVSAIPSLAATATIPPVDWQGPAAYHVTVVNRVPHDVFAELDQELRKRTVAGQFVIPWLTVFQWDELTNRWLFARPK
ncbi:MAG: 2'-5' RNA ligase family protein [Candidatus Kerfeldbacteria bacterium]|nr:2'-5' RNA ligase family protein [Candidatus Kerfeldbacteria bacterium]